MSTVVSVRNPGVGEPKLSDEAPGGTVTTAESAE